MILLRKLIAKSKSVLSRTVDKFFLSLGSGGSFIATIYYILRPSFTREFKSVFAGRKAYKENLKKPEQSSVCLRRNIHRLEKGIIMKPRRIPFGSGYIQETIEAFKSQLSIYTDRKLPKDAKGELQWAYDVLSEYFDINKDSSPVIEGTRQKFEELTAQGFQKESIKPFQRREAPDPCIDFEQFLKLSQRRRSVRWFIKKPVPREKVDQAVLAAGFSPSACNRQPFKFRIFDKPEQVAKISSIPMGTVGFSQNFPGIIVVVGDLSCYFDERDRHLIYIDSSLASMSLMYAFETLGLASCSINWPDIPSKEKEMALALNLQPYQKVIMLIAYGYPDPEGLIPYSQKKPLNQVRSYNQ